MVTSVLCRLQYVFLIGFVLAPLCAFFIFPDISNAQATTSTTSTATTSDLANVEETSAASSSEIAESTSEADSTIAPMAAQVATIIPQIIDVDTTLTLDQSPYVTADSIYVLEGVSLTIEPGVIIKFPARSGLLNYGSIYAAGTEELPIYFTTVNDDAIGGDSAGDGDAVLPQPNDWSGIHTFTDALTTLEHVVVRYGGYPITNGLAPCGPGLRRCEGNLSNAGTLSLSHGVLSNGRTYLFSQLSGSSTISDTHFVSGLLAPSINVQGGSVDISNSSIDTSAYYQPFSSGLDVNTESGAIVYADNNWWGDATGPAHVTINPGGQGAGVTGTDNIAPWLAQDPFAPEVSCEERCSSSVLFLPGIMGSRLFEESSECDSSGEVSEQERWISRDECDHLRLVTDFVGVSINDIYTKDNKSSVIDEAYTFNLYKSFFNDLEKWKEIDKIYNDYAIVPYDWRLRLDDIVKSSLDPATGQIRYNVSNSYQDGYLYKTLESLAEHSSTKKVTVVTHSNGGLVIKHFLAMLQASNDPLVAKIDNIIMVVAPQLGTPDALVGILHGTEIDYVVSQKTARQLMNTMPFAFHLLPGSSYFEDVDTPVITFQDGQTIDNSEALYDFLSVESGRVDPEVEDLETPDIVDEFLLDYAQTTDTILNEWTPAPNTKVYQIAGVGLETPSGLTYFTGETCLNRVLGICTNKGQKLMYRINMTIDGDGTVVTPSALTMSTTDQVDRLWFNFKQFNANEFNRKHKDIFEASDISKFVGNILQTEDVSTYEYLTKNAPTLSIEKRLVFQLHSPLDMSLVTSDGIVSSSTNTIRGGVYRRYGELQYISLPDNSSEKTLILDGVASGSFTLDIEEKNGNDLIERYTYSAIPSSTSTKVVVEINEDIALSDTLIEVDYDGNGETDVKYNEEGVIEDEVTYDTLLAYIGDLQVKKVVKKSLLDVAKTAEKIHNQTYKHPIYKKQEILVLHLMLKQVRLYNKLRQLSVKDEAELSKIINMLLGDIKI